MQGWAKSSARLQIEWKQKQTGWIGSEKEDLGRCEAVASQRFF